MIWTLGTSCVSSSLVLWGVNRSNVSNHQCIYSESWEEKLLKFGPVSVLSQSLMWLSWAQSNKHSVPWPAESHIFLLKKSALNGVFELVIKRTGKEHSCTCLFQVNKNLKPCPAFICSEPRLKFRVGLNVWVTDHRTKALLELQMDKFRRIRRVGKGNKRPQSDEAWAWRAYFEMSTLENAWAKKMYGPVCACFAVRNAQRKKRFWNQGFLFLHNVACFSLKS